MKPTKVELQAAIIILQDVRHQGLEPYLDQIWEDVLEELRKQTKEAK
jgi:hypothetical protein